MTPEKYLVVVPSHQLLYTCLRVSTVVLPDQSLISQNFRKTVFGTLLTINLFAYFSLLLAMGLQVPKNHAADHYLGNTGLKDLKVNIPSTC